MIDKCKENYHVLEETTSLDIRNEFRNNVSNIRCTINGLESIKRYCREDSLDNIENDYISFIQKQYYKDKTNPTKKYTSLQDINFNVRLNLKTENPLSKEHNFVIQFLNDFKNKNKHFRYKKRISFLTVDKLFRIDLSVVKSTRFRNGKYDFQKTFKKANILNNYEEYEVEIEYIGWKKDVGNEEIDKLYNHFNEFFIPGKNKVVLGNIYDPLNLGIKIFDDTDEDYNVPFNEDYKYTDNTIIEDSDKIKHYEDMVGKYMKIKDSYFNNVLQDKKLRDSIKEYSKRGINVMIVKEIVEYSESGIEAIIEMIEPIGEYKTLSVPIEYLYNIPTFTPDDIYMNEIDDGYFNDELPSKLPDEGKDAVYKEIIKKVSEILETHVMI